MWSSLGHEHINRTAQWEPEPKTRGTWSILSTCLITLSLCVWTSLHLNLPEHKKTRSQTWRKVGFLIIGLLAPEIVALVAFRQLSEQRELTRKMEDKLNTLVLPQAKKIDGWFTKLLFLLHMKKKPGTKSRGRASDQDSDQDSIHAMPTSKKSRRYRWSPVHSFLAVMGGFVFDNSHAPEKIPLPRNRTRITLTTRGILLLAELEPDLVPDISEEQIRDKSKTNPLAKTLACLQALWFCAQVLSRLSQNMAVTLLELNTFAHALCALCIYFLWWNKPLDIVEPFLIDVQSDRAAALCATFCDIRDNSRYHPCLINEKPYRQHGLLQVRGWISLISTELPQSPEQREVANERENVQEVEKLPDLLGLRYEIHRITYFVPSCSLISQGVEDFAKPRPGLHIKSEINLDPRVIIRFKLMQSLPELSWMEDADTSSLSCFRSGNWVFARIQDSLAEIINSVNYFLATLAVASCIYGAWHLTAWDGPFRGHTEMVLWRGSAIGLGASAVFVFALTYTSTVGIFIADWVAYLVIVAPLILSTLFMVVCRLCLVVESFIGIMYLPENAYQLPSWSAYFPHIG